MKKSILTFLFSVSTLIGSFHVNAKEETCLEDDNGEILKCYDDDAGPPDVSKLIPYKEKFFQGTEIADMQHTFIGDTPVILDTDFISQSTNAARVISNIWQITESGVVFAIIERRDFKAVLVDKKGLDLIRRERVSLSRCNRKQCTSGIIGGVLNGGLTGAGVGAGLGLIAGPKGAAGGAVIGGAVGMVGGGLDAYAKNPACNCTDHGKNSSDIGDGQSSGLSPQDPPKDKEDEPKQKEEA